MRDTPRTYSPPSLSELPSLCAWCSVADERTDGVAEWSSSRRTGQADGELLDTAEHIVRASLYTLAQSGSRLRNIHSSTPGFSLDCLSANLKRCLIASQAEKLSLFYWDKSGFLNVSRNRGVDFGVYLYSPKLNLTETVWKPVK